MLAILSPGQGAQAPGMLTPWLDVPGAAEHVDRWSDAVGLDLRSLGTTADAETVRDTAVAQPLLTAVSLLSAGALLPDGPPEGAVVVGHSIGELPAASLAGAVPADGAVALAGVRGRAMAAASTAAPTGMSAVLGGDPVQVVAVARARGLELATDNGGGQLVVAGLLDDLAALAEEPPAGARVRPLSVAGAFHTSWMTSAREELRAAMSSVPFTAPSALLLSNADGDPVRDASVLRARLVAQVTAPVRFDRCLAALARLGVTRVVELAPGGTLAGLVRRALPGVDVVALRTPDDLAAAQALVPGLVSA